LTVPRLNSDNALYRSVQNLLPFRLRSKDVKINKLFNNIILPVLLYGCETWSLTLREEHRPRVLRRILGPEREEVTDWKKFRNETLHNLYFTLKYQ
jgi:hypothetical protein